MNNLVTQDVKLEIAQLISRGEITTADDLVARYGVRWEQAIALLGDTKFIALVSKLSKAKAMLAWHSKAIPKLIDFVGNNDPKVAMNAMKMLGQFTESIRGGGLEININLESMVKTEETSNNLKQQDTLSNVIDIEEFRRVISEETTAPAEFRRVVNG